MNIEERATEMYEGVVWAFAETGNYFYPEKQEECYSGILHWWNVRHPDLTFRRYEDLEQYLKSGEDEEFPTYWDFLELCDVHIVVSTPNGRDPRDVCLELVSENPMEDLERLTARAFDNDLIICYEESYLS